MALNVDEAEVCPKHMIYGPCGGVAANGDCEVGGFRCPFVDRPVAQWLGTVSGTTADQTARHNPGASATRALMRSRQIVVADFPARALDLDSLRECADILAGSVDATLLGDAPTARTQFPPVLRAQQVQDRGLSAWAGVNCRDRNRVALEGELSGLAALEVGAVLCLTGDHPLTGSRPDADAVFDLDSTQLAALAHSDGHVVAVGESPAAPPTGRRAERLIQKERAGADVCFINHCGGVEAIARFVAEARSLGSMSDFIACIPLVIDRGSAELLATFPGLALPGGYLEAVLGVRDPRSAGIGATIELCRAVLALEGIAGVNLSGGPTDGAETDYARALAAVGDALLHN